MKKTKLIIASILLILLLIPLTFSLYKIISWYGDNKKTDKAIKLIENTTKITEVEDTIYTDIIVEGKNQNEKFLEVDFEELQKQNSDVRGWININGTNVDYPFVQKDNNSYYLNHSFDNSYNEAGWIFLDYRSNINALDQNTIIYGHGRLDGTMFGSINQTLSEEWFLSQDAHIIKISTLEYNYIFEIFSIYKIKTTNDYLYNTFSTEKEYQDFLIKIKNRSIHNFNNTPNVTDKILTLSTCYNNKEKSVIHAQLIKQQKRI